MANKPRVARKDGCLIDQGFASPESFEHLSRIYVLHQKCLIHLSQSLQRLLLS